MKTAKMPIGATGPMGPVKGAASAGVAAEGNGSMNYSERPKSVHDAHIGGEKCGHMQAAIKHLKS